ncbi:MAG: metal ABC transporter ATP-binding protein, partial [Pseudomonas sp.]
MTHPPVGAGLPAKAECQSISMLNDTPPSRASPLPQG